MGERFKVATCEGYLKPSAMAKGPGIGLSAMVLDRSYAHAVVGNFCSEDFELVRNARGVVKGGKRLGHAGALAKARALADELNADESGR